MKQTLFLNICLSLLLLTTQKALSQQIYYVDAATPTTGDGTINQPFKTIKAAIDLLNELPQSMINQGVKVNVKAGNYENEEMVITVSGTETNPILIQGYQSTPDDQPTYEYDPFLMPNNNLIQFTTSLDDEQLNAFSDGLPMPLLDGGDRTGIAFKLGLQSHITIKNFLITRYKVGVQTALNEGASSHHVVLDNIIGTDFNNDRDLNCYPCEQYAVGCPKQGGYGFEIYGHHQEILNCIIADASNINIAVWGDANRIVNSKSYGTKGIALDGNGDGDYEDGVDTHDKYDATGYYIEMAGLENGAGVVTPAVGSQMIGCLARREEQLCHSGHGIGIKRGQNMLIKDCTSIGMIDEGFYVFHETSEQNVFLNCLVKGKDANGFAVRENAHDNYFVNCQTDTVAIAVTFKNDNVADGNIGGNNNLFFNCLFKGRRGQKTMITFPYYNAYVSGAAVCDYEDEAITVNSGNIFANCIFDGALTLLCLERPISNNQIINSIVTNVSYLASGDAAECCDRYLNGFSLNHNNFYSSFSGNLNDAINLGTGNIAENPQFVNALEGDYNLTCSSPCINSGTDVAITQFLIPDGNNLVIPSFDKVFNERPLDCQNDIGLYEFDLSTCPSPLTINNATLEGYYQSVSTIASNSIIGNENKVIMKAEESITLTSGFHSIAGSDFRAVITPCEQEEGEQVTPKTNTQHFDFFLENENTSIVEKDLDFNFRAVPNPFQNQTTLHFFLSQSTNGTIAIFNQTGKKIKTVLPYQQLEKGNHEVVLSADELDGSFFYATLQTSKERITKKIVLMKNR